jgi:hypothetical protein
MQSSNLMNELANGQESRLQHVESTVAEHGVVLARIECTVDNIDSKLDKLTVLPEKVRDLEEHKKRSDRLFKNLGGAFWLAIAGVGTDVIMRVLEHLHLLK